jgi:hypothetical protein
MQALPSVMLRRKHPARRVLCRREIFVRKRLFAGVSLSLGSAARRVSALLPRKVFLTVPRCVSDNAPVVEVERGFPPAGSEE